MSKTLQKFKKFKEDDSHHDSKRKKLAFKNKQLRSLDNVRKTKDVKKILSFEEKIVGG